MAEDNTLKILIQLGVIGKDDAKAVNQLLKDTETSANKLNLATIDAAKTAKDFIKETIDSNKALQDQGAKLEGNNRLFGILNRIVPDLGTSLYAAFSGPLGPIMLVGIAIAEIREKLKAYNDELDAVSEDELKAHAETVKKLKGSWDDAQESLGMYQAAMAHVGEDNDPIATAIKREKELEEARLERSKRLIERLGQEEQAAIRRNAALHHMPQDQLDAQLAAAKATTEAKLKAADDAKPAANIALMQVELDRRTKAQESLAATEEAARRPADEAAKKLALHKDELKETRDKLDPSTDAGKAAEKKFKDAQNELNNAEAAPNFIGGSTFTGPIDLTDQNQRRIAAAKEKLAHLTQEHNQLEKRRAQLESSEPAIAKDAAEKSATLENARQANLENRKRYIELPAEITQAQSVEALRKNPNANIPNQMGKLDGATALPTKLDETKFLVGTEAQATNNFREFESAHHILEQGGKLTKEQMDKVGRIADAMAGHHVQSKALLDFMRDVLNHNNTRDAAFERELEAIRRTMRPYISNYK